MALQPSSHRDKRLEECQSRRIICCHHSSPLPLPISSPLSFPSSCSSPSFPLPSNFSLWCFLQYPPLFLLSLHLRPSFYCTRSLLSPPPHTLSSMPSGRGINKWLLKGYHWFEKPDVTSPLLSLSLLGSWRLNAVLVSVFSHQRITARSYRSQVEGNACVLFLTVDRRAKWSDSSILSAEFVWAQRMKRWRISEAKRNEEKRHWLLVSYLFNLSFLFNLQLFWESNNILSHFSDKYAKHLLVPES